jgi:lipopolysaccharide transport system ATP-binding protein
MLIRTRIGMEVYGTNTNVEDATIGPVESGDVCEVYFDFPCWLTPQEYTLTVATQSPDGSSHDWLDDVLTFQVIDSRRPAGVANLHARVSSRKLAGRASISA